MSLSKSAELLKTLIAFDTTSSKSNLELITYVKRLLEAEGISTQLVFNADKTKANLFASTGPADVPGIVLSGHSDVVPVTGQDWHTPPFTATEKDGKLFGRGSSDMKGYLACAINAMLAASPKTLHTPLQLCISHDEEIGCVGVRSMLQTLAQAPVKPQLCIIGEPTFMQLVSGHKGKAVYRAICHGEAGHSSKAPRFTNAIYIASDFIQTLLAKQTAVAKAHQDSAFDIPYSTLHIGKIQGGEALNIVPEKCTLDFEIRHLPADNPAQMVADMARPFAAQKVAGNPVLDITQINQYPGLETQPTLQAVKFLQDCLGDAAVPGKIDFGTEGGLFNQALGTPVLVCGPGSINVAHKADEYVDLDQLDRCDAFLSRILNTL